MEFKEMSIDDQKAYVGMCCALMTGVNNHRLTEMSALFVDCLIEHIASNNGITDYRDYSELVVTISHTIENELRDYIEYHLNQEYGPMRKKEADEYMYRKTNLSSLYGSAITEDIEIDN